MPVILQHGGDPDRIIECSCSPETQEFKAFVQTYGRVSEPDILGIGGGRKVRV